MEESKNSHAYTLIQNTILVLYSNQLAVTKDFQWNKIQSPERLCQRTLQNSTDTFYREGVGGKVPIFLEKAKVEF